MVLQEVEMQIQGVLSETIVSACRERLPFEEEFVVEGMLYITLDRSQVMLVNINQSIHRKTPPDGTEHIRPVIDADRINSKLFEHHLEKDYTVDACDTHSEHDHSQLLVKQEAENQPSCFYDQSGSSLEIQNSSTDSPETCNSMQQLQELAQQLQKVPMGTSEPGIKECEETTEQQHIGETEDGEPKHHPKKSKDDILKRSNEKGKSKEQKKIKDDKREEGEMFVRLEGGFQCTTCGKTYGYKHHMQTHIRTHTGERPFLCKYCGKDFTWKPHMQRHEKTHTGEKPFKCSYCLKTFGQKINMIKHQIIHTGEKPHVCHYCGRGFRQKIVLQRHELTHTGDLPFNCRFCNKGYIRKDSLESHEKTHRIEVKYHCKYCGKEYKDKDDLKKHEAAHTGKKLYLCNLCQKGFTKKQYMDKHKMKHHSVVYAEDHGSEQPSREREHSETSYLNKRITTANIQYNSMGLTLPLLN